MAFDNMNTLNADDINAKKKERAASMFGRTVSGAVGASYPFNERVNLPIELIDDNPDNNKIFTMENIEELADAMEDTGFSGAIEVFAKPDGRYEVSSGHRRKLAMMKNNKSTIPAIISPMPDPITRAKKLLGSNIHNRNLSPYEYAMMTEYYRNEVLAPSGFKGNTIEACAKYFMKSTSTIKRYIAILKVIPELQELTKNPVFPYAAFEKAVNFTEEEQKELYKHILDYNRANPGLEISQKYILQTIELIERKRKQEENREYISATQTEKSSENTNIVEEHANRRALDIPKRRLSGERVVERDKENVKDSEEKPKNVPKKKLPPLLPLLKTYCLQLSELKTDNFAIDSKEDIISTLDSLENAILTLKEQINKL